MADPVSTAAIPAADVAGQAAPAICESLLLARNDRETIGIPRLAAAHQNASIRRSRRLRC